MTFKDCNHEVMLGAFLKCPSCRSHRIAKRGQLPSGQEVWYLGCECPAPEGIFTMFHRKPTVRDEVVDYLRMAVAGVERS